MIPELSDQVAVIADDGELREFVAALRRSPWVAIDTEFVRERTYYPHLCLIQLADTERLACIDPLALNDLTPLTELLADESVTKVFHAAGQDLEVLLQETGVLPRPIFDTQVAAALLGHADQIGYARLVEAVLGAQLDKAHSRTDWARRPLSVEEIAYAADDVRYLADLFPRTVDELERRGRLAWLDDEFAEMIDPVRYTPDPENAWRRIKGQRRLRPAQRQALMRLAAWREAAAMAADRPRGWILKDEVLLDLARRRPDSPDALARVRGMPEAVARKHGDTLLSLIREAAEAPAPAPKDTAPAPELDVSQAPLVDLLMAGLRARAAEMDISAGALAGRKDLERLAAGERDLPLLRGWRRAAAGEALLGLVEGNLRLRAGGGSVVWEEADDHG